MNKQERREEVAKYIGISFEEWAAVLVDKHPNVIYEGITPDQVREELAKALEVENYALAAELRDTITELEAQDLDALKVREDRARELL